VLKFYLHDVVYLYLRTVHQILAEGYSDYTDGRRILSKTIGQQFVGMCHIKRRNIISWILQYNSDYSIVVLFYVFFISENVKI